MWCTPASQKARVRQNHEGQNDTEEQACFRHFSANATSSSAEIVLVLNEMVLLLVLGLAMRNEYEYRLRLSTKISGFQASKD